MNDWNRSVLKVLNRKTNELIGAAFFISPNTLLSAKHIFEDIKSEDILIRGTAWSNGKDLQIKSPISHPELDVCIFTLKIKMSGYIQIPLASKEMANLSNGKTVILLGYKNEDSNIEERESGIIPAHTVCLRLIDLFPEKRKGLLGQIDV